MAPHSALAVLPVLITQSTSDEASEPRGLPRSGAPDFVDSTRMYMNQLRHSDT